jgi:hypothetical protein
VNTASDVLSVLLSSQAPERLADRGNEFLQQQLQGGVLDLDPDLRCPIEGVVLIVHPCGDSGWNAAEDIRRIADHHIVIPRDPLARGSRRRPESAAPIEELDPGQHRRVHRKLDLAAGDDPIRRLDRHFDRRALRRIGWNRRMDDEGSHGYFD